MALVYSSNVVCVTFTIYANVLEMMDDLRLHRPLGHNVCLRGVGLALEEVRVGWYPEGC